MRLLMTGRHVKVTPALKRYVEGRLSRLTRYCAEVGDVQVVIGVEKYRHSAEAKLAFNGVAIQAKASTNEMYASIDVVLDKIARQLAKRKEKLVSHKARPVSARTGSAASKPAAPWPRIQTVVVPLPTLTVDEAVERLSNDSSSLVIFLNASVDRVQVVRQLESGTVELMDPRSAPTRLR
jgi:putative sigma-54 modulation protein